MGEDSSNASVESAASEQQVYASAEEALTSYLGNYEAPVPDYLRQPGLLDDRYQIDFDSPLPSLSGEFSKALMVADKKATDHPEIFATILDRQIPYRMGAIKTLLSLRTDHYMDLLAAGAVQDPRDNVTRYCLIQKRPRGVPLSEYIQDNSDSVHEKLVIEQWMPAIAKSLLSLHRRGVAHNCINPDTIFVSRKVMLGECVSAPAGFRQDFHFEAPEKIVTHPSGHGHGDMEADYYALGALLAFLLTKGKLFTHDDRESFTHKLLNEGAYELLVGGRQFAPFAEDLLRGTLNEKRKDRWGMEQLEAWLGGKQFNLIRPSPPREAPRPFSFSGKEFFNRKSLANGLCLHWNSARSILRDNQLIRWLTLSALKSDLSGELQRLVQATGGNNRRSMREDNELVAKTIIKLDPVGPIRMGGASAALDGIGTMIAYSARENRQETIDNIREMIREDLPNYWMNLQKGGTPHHYIGYLRQMEKLRLTVDSQTLGFGKERLLYELNPSLPCQSSMLAHCHVLDIRQMLEALDYLAGQHHQKHSLVEPTHCSVSC